MAKILIIEDNDSTRENINDILELEGFETFVATHGAQGLELAQMHHPDLIICDVMMPQLDGYAVLENLGKQEGLACIPFIFLTAKSTHLDFREGMTLGANDYLTKPFSPAELVKAVGTQLRKQQRVEQSYTKKIKVLEQNIERLAQVDALTQLPNQIALGSRLDQLGGQQKALALCLIAVDQASFLSSVLSPEDNDHLITLVTHRIRSIFPQINEWASMGEMFRLAQNQLAVLLDFGDSSRDRLPEIATQMLNALNEPYLLSAQTITLTASIGIAATATVALPSATPSTVETLIHDAATALYAAQQQGGNHYCFYHQEISLNAAAKLRIASALHHALQRQEFQVYYQPQVDLGTGAVVGVEALLRWHSAELGSVSPGLFIPIAEEIGVIDDISNWVLETACRQAQEWQGVMAQPLSVSVNLSPIQLSQAQLFDTVSAILEKTGFPPQLLHLEITETALIKHQHCAIQALQAIEALGVQIAIDDFGTGYSGLGYLSIFPCNTIKIDRLFIQDIDHHPTNQSIVSAVINLSRELNLLVIAEGAETADELVYLKSQGCDMVQGYVYAKPMPAVEVVPFVEATSLQAVQAG